MIKDQVDLFVEWAQAVGPMLDLERGTSPAPEVKDLKAWLCDKGRWPDLLLELRWRIDANPSIYYDTSLEYPLNTRWRIVYKRSRETFLKTLEQETRKLLNIERSERFEFHRKKHKRW